MKWRTKTGLEILVTALSVTFIPMALLSCGSGGGGGGAPPTAAPKGTFVKTPHHTSVGSWDGHFSALNPDLRVQQLYSGRIGLAGNRILGSGYITAIALRSNETTSVAITCPDITLKMGHTSLTALTTTFADNVEQGRGSVVTVLQNKRLVVPPVSAGSYFTINLDTPFYFNGADNLVVDFIRTGACSGTITLQYDDTLPGFEAVVTDVLPTGSLTRAPNMQFHFRGGDNRVQYPNGIGDAVPLGTSASGRHVQMLHLASDINGSGPITGIAMISSETPTGEAGYTVTVKLGHTLLTALTSTFADNFVGSPVTVASAATFTVPAGVPAGTPIWLPVTGAFTYNGIGNLIVDIEAGDPAAKSTSWLMDTAKAGRHMLAAPGSPTGTVYAGAYHTVFRFRGGNMDVLTPAGMSGGWLDSFPFAVEGKRQYLYRSDELGAKGTISKIACRRGYGTETVSGYDYTVIMSHTTGTTLGADFAANLLLPITVFDGTLDIPALPPGDWIEIPLTTNFAFNGKDNLVVQIAGTGGAEIAAACVLDQNSTVLHASRRVYSASSTASTGTTSNALIDMRFTFQ